MSQLQSGIAGQGVLFAVSDNDGAVTDRTAANFTIGYLRLLNGIPLAASATAITPLSDLAAWNTTHTPGGVRHLFNGIYLLHVPDAVSLAGANAAMFDIVSDESGDVVNVLGAVSNILGIVQADVVRVAAQPVATGVRMRQIAVSDTNKSADVVFEEVT